MLGTLLSMLVVYSVNISFLYIGDRQIIIVVMEKRHVDNMSAFIPFLAVAAGGAIGAVLRFSVYKVVDTSLPWATFIVNIVGCVLASFLMFKYGLDMQSTLRSFIFVGMFGAFTTMSTFSIDTVNLLVDGSYGLAVGNILINSVLCVFGAVCGRYLALI